MELLELIEKIVAITVGGGGFLLAFYTLVINRHAVFKNSLHNRQLEELEKMRSQLFKIFFNLHLLKISADAVQSENWSLEDLRKISPDDWQNFQAYKSDSMEMFYRLGFENNYLLPNWFDRSKFQDIYEEMKKFVPFTVHSLIQADGDELLKYQGLVGKKIDDLDKILSKQA